MTTTTAETPTTTTATALVHVIWRRPATGTQEETTGVVKSSSLFVMTDNLPPIDARVRLTVAFGDLVTEGYARVANVSLSVDPGAPSGFGAELDSHSALRLNLSALLARTPPPATSTSRPLRVVHVEESKLLRDMFAYGVRRFFESYNANANNTPELISVGDILGVAGAISERPVDIVIVDDAFANRSGEEIVRETRMRLGSSVWILGVGLGGQATRDRLLESGADVYVQKPIVLTDILHSIRLLGCAPQHVQQQLQRTTSSTTTTALSSATTTATTTTATATATTEAEDHARGAA